MSACQKSAEHDASHTSDVVVVDCNLSEDYEPAVFNPIDVQAPIASVDDGNVLADVKSDVEDNGNKSSASQHGIETDVQTGSQSESGLWEDDPEVHHPETALVVPLDEQDICTDEDDADVMPPLLQPSASDSCERRDEQKHDRSTEVDQVDNDPLRGAAEAARSAVNQAVQTVLARLFGDEDIGAETHARKQSRTKVRTGESSLQRRERREAKYIRDANKKDLMPSSLKIPTGAPQLCGVGDLQLNRTFHLASYIDTQRSRIGQGKGERERRKAKGKGSGKNRNGESSLLVCKNGGYKFQSEAQLAAHKGKRQHFHEEEKQAIDLELDSSVEVLRGSGVWSSAKVKNIPKRQWSGHTRSAMEAAPFSGMAVRMQVQAPDNTFLGRDEQVQRVWRARPSSETARGQVNMAAQQQIQTSVSRSGRRTRQRMWYPWKPPWDDALEMKIAADAVEMRRASSSHSENSGSQRSPRCADTSTGDHALHRSRRGPVYTRPKAGYDHYSDQRTPAKSSSAPSQLRLEASAWEVDQAEQFAEERPQRSRNYGNDGRQQMERPRQARSKPSMEFASSSRESSRSSPDLRARMPAARRHVMSGIGAYIPAESCEAEPGRRVWSSRCASVCDRKLLNGGTSSAGSRHTYAVYRPQRLS